MLGSRLQFRNTTNLIGVLYSLFINSVDLFISKYSLKRKNFNATSLDEQKTTFRHKVVVLKNQTPVTHWHDAASQKDGELK